MSQITASYPDGGKAEVPYGTRVQDLLAKELAQGGKDPIVACLVNNELVSLSFKIKVNCDIKPVRLSDHEGMAAYKRSLCFLLALVGKRLFPNQQLVLGHSLGDGYFYYFQDQDSCDPSRLAAMERALRELVDKAAELRRSVVSYADAVRHFKATGQLATAEILEYRVEAKIPVYLCEDYMDLAYGPLVPHAGILKTFQLFRYDPGFVLRFPTGADLAIQEPFRDSPLLFSIYREYKDWGKVLNLSTVGKLNRISTSKEVKQFIQVAEALHNKKIARIADLINQRRKEVRAVLIAGPSSSGKTTFTKRLAIELTVLGYKPSMLSLDDYFLPREQTPRDESGNYDFESLRAIDIDLLNQDLVRLFQGEEVELPLFDFKTGHRKAGGRRMILPPEGILLIEGIHGLNDSLTPLVERTWKFKVYVSALTQLNLDENNRIATTDNRLIRRLVRDYQFRGHTALTTLSMWPSVRRGENRNIFPFQDTADAAFNSALDYELGVLQPLAEPILRSVRPDQETYREAVRLLSFLNNFLPIPAKYVPEYSILREFIGDSGFKY